MVVQTKAMNKILYVNTNGRCNNFCLGCGVFSDGEERPIEDIIKDMKEGSRVGYENLHLIGGEPTILKNLYELLIVARKLFKQIYLTSNGRRFIYDSFAKEISGMVDAISISLHGDSAVTHESWTRVKGSFAQTVGGIKNLVKYKRDSLCVNHLVWKGNYDKLRSLLQFDLNLGVKNIGLLNVEPTGLAKKIFSSICVPLSKLNNFDRQFSDLIENFDSVEVEDFPMCLFSPDVVGKQNFHIQEISGQIYLDKLKNITTYGIFAMKEFGFPINSNLEVAKNLSQIVTAFKTYRMKLKACNGCQFANNCQGLFCEYVNIFSCENVEKELSLIRKKWFKC